MFKLISFIACALLAGTFNLAFGSSNSAGLEASQLIEEVVDVNFQFEFDGLKEPCSVRVISDASGGMKIKKVSDSSPFTKFNLTSGVVYRLEILSAEIGMITHNFTCEEGSSEVSIGVLLKGISSTTNALLGVQAVFISANDLDSMKNLASSDESLASIIDYEGIDAVTRVQFLKTADEVREMITKENLRFEVNKNASVFYLSNSNADINSSSSYEILVGEVTEVLTTLSNKTDQVAETPIIQLAKTESLATNEITDQIYFSVQLGSFVKAVSNPEDTFSTNSVINSFQEGNRFKYFSGMFNNYQEAVSHKDELLELGKSGVFVIAIKAGAKISLDEAIRELKDKKDLE